MNDAGSTILVRVFGPDGPGLTAGLMDVLSAGNCELYDVEQVVVRDRLSLNVLVSVSNDETLDEVLSYAKERGLTADFEPLTEIASPARGRFAVSVIGARVDPQTFGAVSRAIANAGGNIDSIERLSRYPVVSYELAVSGGDQAAMRTALLETSAMYGVDLAVQAEGIARRSKRLVVMDVDSTLIQDEVIELLAAAAGKQKEIAAATALAMEGEVDFAESLTDRVRLLEGVPVAVLDEVAAAIRLTPGARTFIRTLKRMGMRIGLLSGGFTWFTDRLAAELELDHSYANELEIEDGRLTGRLLGPIVDRARKAEILREIARAEGIALDQVVAIGDGANDLDMLAAAGLGIGFNPKPIVRGAADSSVSVPYLDAILFVLGIRRDEVESDGDAPEVGGLPPL